MREVTRPGLRCLTEGKALALEDGKGRDRSKVIRAILDRVWRRGEATCFLCASGGTRHQGRRWLATWA